MEGLIAIPIISFSVALIYWICEAIYYADQSHDTTRELNIALYNKRVHGVQSLLISKSKYLSKDQIKKANAWLLENEETMYF